MSMWVRINEKYEYDTERPYVRARAKKGLLVLVLRSRERENERESLGIIRLET